MSKRNYNVFFNTHTVSGIIISFALYVIFFAGAFALIKEQIQIWEEGKAITHTQRQNIDFDKMISKLDDEHDLLGRDLRINFEGEQDFVSVFMPASKDSLALEKGKASHYFHIDINTIETTTYPERYSLGEFLYRLHFFAQLPTIGIYLAGIVAMFFLFAIITGVIVHWKKIIPNFYSFNPISTLKRVWTDAHTALGFIGLPFQFIFAVTGAYFALNILVLLPANTLYNGNQEKLLEDLRPDRKNYEWQGAANPETDIASFNEFAKKTFETWEHFKLSRGYIKNYGGSNMKYILMGEFEETERFLGQGSVIFDVASGTTELLRDPNISVYTQDVQRLMGKLHFGEFEGLPIKLIYFVLALITCFVIITGVLIWVEARNKKSMTLKQRLYTAKVGHVYLAISLSMLPVTALAFLFVKFTNGYFESKQTAIYYFYFITWLIAILFFVFKRDNYFTNKYCLLLGAIFGFLIPIANGIVSGNWIWVTYTNHQLDILLIDIIWLITGATAFVFYLKLQPKDTLQSTFNKNPIDYKDVAALKAEHQENERQLEETTNNNQNYLPMRTKIITLWMLIIFGFIFHHIYGLATVFFKESVVLESATGETPFWAHQWRILMEGLAFLFAILTLTTTKQWFKWTSFIWAIILALFNIYHIVEAVMHEASNYSELFILILLAVVSVLLVLNLNKWKNIKTLE